MKLAEKLASKLGKRGVTRVISELLILFIAVGLIAIFFLWIKGWWDDIIGDVDELIETIVDKLWCNMPNG